MRKWIMVVAMLLLVVVPASARPKPRSVKFVKASVKASLLASSAALTTTHQVNLVWTLSSDDTTTNCPTITSCAQSVYRAAGTCSSTTTFTTALTTLSSSATTYIDTSVVVGQSYCYAVSFTANGTESSKSNQASAVVIPFSPTGFTASGQ